MAAVKAGEGAPGSLVMTSLFLPHWLCDPILLPSTTSLRPELSDHLSHHQTVCPAQLQL